MLGDSVDRSAGPIELTIDEKGSVVLDAGSDGCSLEATVGAWIDPFDRQLDPEDEACIATHGKWTGFDVSDAQPWAPLIGQTIDAVDPRISGRGRPSEESASLRIGNRSIEVMVVADELQATVVEM